MTRTALATLVALGWLAGSDVASAEPGTAQPPPPASPPVEIIGGATTMVGQYPTVVGLVIGSNLCTGTLVAPSWVLTAAHCVDPQVLNLASQDEVTRSARIHFNTVDVVNDLGTVVMASATFKDPLFNKTKLGSNDIGLIQLATPITDVVPSPINLNAAMAPVGTVVTIVGYGSTEKSGQGTIGVEFELRNRISMSCPSLGVGSDTNLLCFSQADDKGTCQGDSGGPAFAVINGRPVVVGVTSFGDQQCASYGADTRVDIEQPFLVDHVPELVGCLSDGDCPTHRVCFAHNCIAAPFGPTGIGTLCQSGADCDSSVCAESSQDGKRCSLPCNVTDGASCPDGFECLHSTGSVGACWPEPGGGCCDAGGRGGAGAALLGLGVIGWLRRRRAGGRAG
ncbi:MAG: trypsin-like serine protease [Deltaproteobacteria bacterium]|nr:MAG: trypsin-like serine protease [Deltaproteobacteria bacterium]